MKTYYRRPALRWPQQTESVLNQVRQIAPQVLRLRTEWAFYLETIGPLSKTNQARVKWFLSETFEQPLFDSKSFLEECDVVLEFGPRIAIVSPWSTNVSAIFAASGLSQIERCEQARRYGFILEPGTTLSTQQIRAIATLLYDPMTEELYRRSLRNFGKPKRPDPVKTIPIRESGLEAVHWANEVLGTSISDQLGQYAIEYFLGLGRDPTDIEWFGFGQDTSEHCRHPHFGGLYVIDGVAMPESLFEMIKSTTAASPKNVLLAYRDNAAAFSPRECVILIPRNPTGPSVYHPIKIQLCDTLKVETHNHPTLSEAFQGAGTGVGGDVRDMEAIGRGGYPVDIAAGYCVGNLRIPGYPLPWERELFPHPVNYRTPLEIILGASRGASDYGNKFGVPLTLGFVRTFEQLVDNRIYAYTKPVMMAGSTGVADQRHVFKEDPQKGQLIVLIGGEGYRIGVGGGSGSSKDAGTQSATLDFNSVQRANPEMGNRVNWVIRDCVALGDENPLSYVGDLGAGGAQLAITEALNPAGGKIEIRDIPVGDKSMPIYVIGSNESQERLIFLIWEYRLDTLKQICERNRCPIAVVGQVTGDGQLVFTDRDAPDEAPREQKIPVDVSLSFLLSDLPRKEIVCRREERRLQPFTLPNGFNLVDELRKVLRLLTVGSKHFLTIHQADRTVGGRIAQQQTIGPLQLTLADYAITANSLFGLQGLAKAIGEQPIIGLVNPAAGGRMSIAEALTNLAWAKIDGLGKVNFSATWQWAISQPGENARLYDTVKAARDLNLQLKTRIPVGKDSLSMVIHVRLPNGEKVAVTAPGTVQFLATAPISDITKAVTPDIKAPGQSRLMLLDLAPGYHRLGGSALAQVNEQIGNVAPDLDDPDLFCRGFQATQELIDRDLILAGHDRSDGGLIVTLLEMAFAGNCGLDLSFNGRQIWGDDVLAALFSQELGQVFEYLPEKEDEIRTILDRHGVERFSHHLGKTLESTWIIIEHDSNEVMCGEMQDLRQVWHETSDQIDVRQTNPDCVREERNALYERPGIFVHENVLSCTNYSPVNPHLSDRLINVAVLSEEGTNGAQELAESAYLAGFKVYDVRMTDVIKGRFNLDTVQGLLPAGGWTFADALGAGKGQAGVALFNPQVADQFARFYDREDTFSIGICNGFQLLTLLGWIPFPGIPPERQPRLILNRSETFESRFVMTKILPSPAIALKDMEGMVLGAWIAHREGRCYFPDESVLEKVVKKRLAPIRYVDDWGTPTQDYPYNPNGSELGITALCTADGRHLAMPHGPDRSVIGWQWGHRPPGLAKDTYTPWLKMLQNVREWCEERR